MTALLTEKILSVQHAIIREIHGEQIHSAQREVVMVRHIAQTLSVRLETIKEIHGEQIHSAQLEAVMTQIAVQIPLVPCVVTKHIIVGIECNERLV
jgi:hypothetical protein